MFLNLGTWTDVAPTYTRIRPAVWGDDINILDLVYVWGC
eukprot:COSAG02_NODE_62999_length_264_cov_0.842424_1_plen_38_part_01